MGQKVNPIGFRLGITKPFLSQWFADKKNYSIYFFEDYFLRKMLQEKYEKAGFEEIKILRKIENTLHIIILAEKPDVLVGLKGKNLKSFQNEIKKAIEKYRQSNFFRIISLSKNIQMESNKSLQKLNKNLVKNNSINSKHFSKIKLTLHVVGTSHITASFVGDILVELLEKRTPYRAALNFILKKKIQEKLQGIKIQISGRLNGAEIARSEWIRKGQLPLHTLSANIDYSFKKAYTIYGVLGVKVWIFTSQKIYKKLL